MRAALRHLRGPLGHCFHLYVSLSSPHLGIIKGRSRLVSLGLWVLKKWRKSLCLQQLTLSYVDAADDTDDANNDTDDDAIAPPLADAASPDVSDAALCVVIGLVAAVGTLETCGSVSFTA